jgi:hypothetical protein
MTHLTVGKSTLPSFVNPDLDGQIMFHIWKIVEIVRADAKSKIAEALAGRAVNRRTRGQKKQKVVQGHRR